jgi:hypothetical protein
MSSFSRGRVYRYSRQKFGRLVIDPLTQGVSRVGKQSAYGPVKGSTPPGKQGTNSTGVARR